jgi:serine-type D-Ala-D-Ala carboxypeptidase (penicillin-binding protein 5/6)
VTRLVLALTLSFVSALAPHFAAAQNLSLPPFTAKSWLVTDVTANHIIAASNANERVEPASLTKLMTAYIVFNALRDKKIERAQAAPVSQRAWKTGGSKMFIEPLKKVTVEELMHGMIVQSGNDASIALAELIAGSEEAFAGMMNAEAKRLGMANSNFTNSSGLPDAKHYSTAFDIALLAGAIIREHPELYGLYAVKEYRYNNITQPNRNRLLWLDPNVDGMKTGHTQSAGFCLVASAKRADRRLLSVIMGAPSDSVRAQESQTLLNFGFQSFDTVRLYEKSKPIANLKLWKGEAKELKAGVAADLYVAIPRGTNDKIKAELTSQQPLLAPIAKGQRIGTVKVAYDGKPVAEYPVLAMEEVAVAGFFGRSWDSVLLWFK